MFYLKGFLQSIVFFFFATNAYVLGLGIRIAGTYSLKHQENIFFYVSYIIHIIICIIKSIAFFVLILTIIVISDN